MIQEFVAVFLLGHQTAFVFAKDAIPITRYQIVDSISQPFWDHDSQSENPPNSTQLAEHVNDCI